MFRIDWCADWNVLSIMADKRNRQDIYLFKTNNNPFASLSVIVPLFYIEGTIGL